MGVAMTKRLSMCQFGLGTAVSVALLSTPAGAAPKRTPVQQKQLSEVVFENYPAQSLLAGEQGPVYFLVWLDDKAHPTKCQVTHGSGFPRLDAATCDLIVQHATFKSTLGPDGRATKSMHEGVVNWRIPGTPQPPINPIPLAKADAPEPQICKRRVKVGTLAGFERTCMTRQQWEVAAKESRDYWEDLQGRKGLTYDCADGDGDCELRKAPGDAMFDPTKPH